MTKFINIYEIKLGEIENFCKVNIKLCEELQEQAETVNEELIQQVRQNTLREILKLSEGK